MRLKHKTFTLLAFAIPVLTACTNETIEVPQSELYAREFIKQFGIPDAGHKWSMAQSSEIKITLDKSINGTLEVYTDAFPSATSRQLAAIAFNGSSVTGRFDVTVGTKEVYARIIDEYGTIACDGYISLDSGKSRSSVGASRTATESSALPGVTELSCTAYRIPEEAVKYYQDNLDKYANYQEAKDGYERENENMYLNLNGPSVLIPNLKLLTGLYNVTGTEFRWKQLQPIFKGEYIGSDGVSHPGVFAEGVDHIKQYYHETTDGIKLDPDVTFNILSRGPVTMECIWRGTDYYDYFGYYYYPKGKELTPEELWNLPKYAFLTPDDIRETSSLTQYASYNPVTRWDNDKQQHVVVEDKWDEWQNLNGMETGRADWWNDEHKLHGTRYSLTYYGENYDEPGSYIFPEDVQIGYFILKERAQQIFFSDCALNYYLTNQTYSPRNGGESMNGPYARPFAAKFTYDRRTYIGFGDGSGDCDLNDVVFIVSNVYPAPDDITPDDVKPDVQSWTLACEDLGATDDFDFNDVVIDVEYAAGSGELTFIPRAAGGSLASDIYFNNERLGEIHAMLNTGPGVITNVHSGGATVDPQTVKPVTVKVDPDWRLTQEEGGFYDLFKIHTFSGGSSSEGTWLESYIELPGVGKLPQMLLLRQDWHWPTERSHISKAYTRFPDWTRDQAIFDWDSHKQPSLTVSYR